MSESHKMPVKYSETESALNELKETAGNLPEVVDSVKTRAMVSAFVSQCVSLRTGLDRHRKDLTKEARDYQAFVNSEAKKIVSKIDESEQEQKQKIIAYDNAKQRAKDEAKRIDDERIEKIKCSIDRIERATLCGDELLGDTLKSMCELLDKGIGEFYQEFAEEAALSLGSSIACLEGRIEQKVKDEAEREQFFIDQKKLAEEKAELDKQRKEDEAKLREAQEVIAKALLIEKAKLDKERAELAAVKKRQDDEAAEIAKAKQVQEAELAAKKAADAAYEVAQNKQKATDEQIEKCYNRAETALKDICYTHEDAHTADMGGFILDAIKKGNVPHVKFTVDEEGS